MLANLDKLVVKPANESGGYGMLVGPHATTVERSKFVNLIKRNPRNYIAQPTLGLSTAPTICGQHVEPRHLDLRPFILQSDRTYVTAGGLTGWHCARVHWWSIHRRAAAARTPGSWTQEATDMLSRVAERLYWTARYLERAENTARLVRVFSYMMLDLPSGVGLNWRQLVDVSGAHEYFDRNYRSSGERNVVKFMLSDTDTQAR